MQRGVTFIELLFAVAIILVIISASVLIINPQEKQALARDQVRISDLQVLDRVVNDFLLDNGRYPDSVNVLRVSDTLPVGNTSLASSESGWLLEDLSAYKESLPIDPLNTDIYVYSYIHTNTTYELNAQLEILSAVSSDDGGDDPARYEMGNDLTLITP